LAGFFYTRYSINNSEDRDIWCIYFQKVLDKRLGIVDRGDMKDTQNKLKPCTCKDWKVAVPQIQTAQLVNDNHHGKPYTGKQFIYCPWCGKKREVSDAD